MKQISNIASIDYKIIEYPDGIYQGEYLQKQREGFGIFSFDQGQMYIGLWSQDKPNGGGVFYFQKEGFMIANFENGKAEGICQIQVSEDHQILGTILGGVFNNLFYHKYFDNWKQIDISKHSPIESTIQEAPLLLDIKQVYNNQLELIRNNQIGICHLQDGMWFVGKLDQKGFPNGLGVIHDKNNKVLKRGNIENQLVNGLGRVQMNGIVRDGIFINEELKFGIVYNEQTSDYQYGHFNQRNQIIKQGKGFPFDLIKQYRHPINSTQFRMLAKTCQNLVLLPKILQIFNYFPSEYQIQMKELNINLNENEKSIALKSERSNNSPYKQYLISPKKQKTISSNKKLNISPNKYNNNSKNKQNNISNNKQYNNQSNKQLIVSPNKQYQQNINSTQQNKSPKSLSYRKIVSEQKLIQKSPQRQINNLQIQSEQKQRKSPLKNLEINQDYYNKLESETQFEVGEDSKIFNQNAFQKQKTNNYNIQKKNQFQALQEHNMNQQQKKLTPQWSDLFLDEEIAEEYSVQDQKTQIKELIPSRANQLFKINTDPSHQNNNQQSSNSKFYLNSNPENQRSFFSRKITTLDSKNSVEINQIYNEILKQNQVVQDNP